VGQAATARPTPLRKHKVEEVWSDREPRRELLIDGDGLMGAAELAEALGIRVQNIRFVRDLPEAIAHLRSSRIWLASEIYEFADQLERKRRIR